MDLYSLNKQLVSQMPNMEDFADSIELINKFARKNSNKYYMLLCRDISYYTVFERLLGLTETIGEAVITCLNSIGTSIKSIEEVKGAIECWVVPFDEKDPVAVIFFPYDIGMYPVGV